MKINKLINLTIVLKNILTKEKLINLGNQFLNLIFINELYKIKL